MDQIPRDSNDGITSLRGGDRQALAMLFEQHRQRLRRMVELRLDPRLRARLDASDVVQEAFLDVAGDLDAYLADPKLPPLLWMRLHVGRRLTTLHRQHLGTRMRDAGQEISLDQGTRPRASSTAMAVMRLNRLNSPTLPDRRAERMRRVQESAEPRRPRCCGSRRRPARSGASSPCGGSWTHWPLPSVRPTETIGLPHPDASSCRLIVLTVMSP
jgi:RNA polymerase sigma-70 factor (ECF subfamily)